MIRHRAACALFVAVAACATPRPLSFDIRRGDDTPDALATLLARVDPARPESDAPSWTGTALVVAATRDAHPTLVAFDPTTGRVHWRADVAAETRPEILGDVVVVTAAGTLVALDATNGRVRWRLALADPAYFGAARSGARLFVTTGPLEHAASARVFALHARTGAMLWQREAPAPLGRPVTRGGLLWVPWQRQHLVALDPDDGRERARLRARDHAIEWVSGDAPGVVFGDRDLARLTPGYDGSRIGSPRLTLPIEHLPSAPAPYPSAFAPAPRTGSAHGRIGVHYALRGDGRISLFDDTFYFVFYRAVFAFDLAGNLRWARLFEDDVVAARAVPGALVSVLGSGRVRALSAASGAEGSAGDVGLPLDTAALAIRDFPRPAVEPAASLRDALVAIAVDPDARLLPARAFAVRQLALLPAPEATRDLLDVDAQDSTPLELRRVVADALATRTTGIEHVVDALDRHPDFLERRAPAPLPILVPALVRARETRAIPGLIAWMRDPETPDAMLPRIVDAVSEIGDASIVEPLHAMLRSYRADSAFADAPDALVAAARGILRHGGAGGRAQVEAVAGAPGTSRKLATALRDLLSPPRGDVLAPRETVAPPRPALPARLTAGDIHATFAEHVDDVRDCVLPELDRDPTLARVRIAFLVEGNGNPYAWSFVPNTVSFADCMAPKVRRYRFPAFSASRQVATYSIALRKPTPPARSPDPPARAGAWWARAASTPAAPGAVAPPPWWRVRPLSIITVDAPATRPAAAQATPATEPAPASAAQEVVPAPEDRWWVPAAAPPSNP